MPYDGTTTKVRYCLYRQKVPTANTIWYPVFSVFSGGLYYYRAKIWYWPDVSTI